MLVDLAALIANSTSTQATATSNATWVGNLFEGVVVGIVTGIVSSIIVIKLTMRYQEPKFEVVPDEDRYSGEDKRWVHLKVKNVSKPFLGGGEATNCRGEVTINGKPYFTKWATRPEPLRLEVVAVGDGKFRTVVISDPVLYDTARNEYIPPGEEKTLDVAYRAKGDESCFVNIPENYPNPRNDTRVGTGQFEFTLVLHYSGGKSNPFKFLLKNGEGDSPGQLTIGRAP